MKKMSRAGLALATLLLGADTASSQQTTNSSQQLPDACRLLPKSDLVALYPGRGIEEKGSQLSPISRGPQYVSSCQYLLRLPSANSQSDVARFASITIVKTGTSVAEATRSFSALRTLSSDLASDAKNNLKITPQPDIGDAAFLETREGNLAITVRKDELIFTVRIDYHADDTLLNLQALAKQSASRWRQGHPVDASDAIAHNEKVEVPTDTRVPSVAPVETWPDACALLTSADLAIVFPDAKIKPPKAMQGKITHDGRERQVEMLPKPIACLFDISRPNPAGTRPARLYHQAQVAIKNVAATPELSKEFYKVTERVVGPLDPLADLGDEAGIDKLNRITIRKGIFAIEVKVTGGERDQALHAEAKDKALMLSKIAVKRLP